jgi:hypothetical protein
MNTIYSPSRIVSPTAERRYLADQAAWKRASGRAGARGGVRGRPQIGKFKRNNERPQLARQLPFRESYFC